MNNSLITVIVPVYNVEEYLCRCVDSIINQTYQNLEIILVDDGSTDGSGALCDRYAEQDSRIVVVHKENGGQSTARNLGIEHAKGQYIVFVDSDDYVMKDYIEYLHFLLQSNDADISMCDLKKVYNERGKLDEVAEDIIELGAYEALEELMYQRIIHPGPCCKLYKREIFDAIKYPEGMQYEDLAVIYKILDKCKKIVVGKKQKYYYFQRENSTMNEIFNPKKMQRIQVANDMKEYVDLRYPTLSEATSARCFLAGIQVFREIPKNGEYEEYVNDAWKQIVEYRAAVVRNGKAKASMRVMALSSYFGKYVLGILGQGYSLLIMK